MLKNGGFQPRQISNAHETARSNRCAVLVAASAYFFGFGVGTNAALIFFRMREDRHRCLIPADCPSKIANRPGKVIIGFDLGMDWDER
jgi:hypothetical protein